MVKYGITVLQYIQYDMTFILLMLLTMDLKDLCIKVSKLLSILVPVSPVSYPCPIPVRIDVEGPRLG